MSPAEYVCMSMCVYIYISLPLPDGCYYNCSSQILSVTALDFFFFDFFFYGLHGLESDGKLHFNSTTLICGHPSVFQITEAIFFFLTYSLV